MNTNKHILVVLIAGIGLALLISAAIKDGAMNQDTGTDVITYGVDEHHPDMDGTAPRTMSIVPPSMPSTSSTEEAQAKTLSLVFHFANS